MNVFLLRYESSLLPYVRIAPGVPGKSTRSYFTILCYYSGCYLGSCRFTRYPRGYSYIREKTTYYVGSHGWMFCEFEYQVLHHPMLLQRLLPRRVYGVHRYHPSLHQCPDDHKYTQLSNALCNSACSAHCRSYMMLS
jgi:hypothetical protein